MQSQKAGNGFSAVTRVRAPGHARTSRPFGAPAGVGACLLFRGSGRRRGGVALRARRPRSSAGAAGTLRREKKRPAPDRGSPPQPVSCGACLGSCAIKAPPASDAEGREKRVSGRVQVGSAGWRRRAAVRAAPLRPWRRGRACCPPGRRGLTSPFVQPLAKGVCGRPARGGFR